MLAASPAPIAGSPGSTTVAPQKTSPVEPPAPSPAIANLPKQALPLRPSHPSPDRRRIAKPTQPRAIPSQSPSDTMVMEAPPQPAALTASGTTAGAGKMAAAERTTTGQDTNGKMPPGNEGGGQATIDAYLATIRKHIQESLVYPPAARRLGLAGQVRLRFTIEGDGRVAGDSLHIVGGSDASLLQDGAVETIRNIAAFPPPPAGSIGIEVPVLFSLIHQG
jgi:protein TonB